MGRTDILVDSKNVGIQDSDTLRHKWNELSNFLSNCKQSLLFLSFMTSRTKVYICQVKSYTTKLLSISIILGNIELLSKLISRPPFKGFCNSKMNKKFSYAKFLEHF